MKIAFLIFLIAFSSLLSAASNTFMDYQNYNHGYCPDCNCYPCKCNAGGACPHGVSGEGSCNLCPKPDPCCPPATSCGTQCGVSVCAIGATIAIVAGVAAIIVSSGNGTAHAH